jgi:hypothetical protein
MWALHSAREHTFHHESHRVRGFMCGYAYIVMLNSLIFTLSKGTRSTYRQA